MRTPNHYPTSPIESVNHYQKEVFLVPKSDVSLVIDKQTTHDDSLFIFDLNSIDEPLDSQHPTILAQKDRRDPKLTRYTLFWNEPTDGILRPQFQIFDMRKTGENVTLTPTVEATSARDAFYKASTFGDHALKVPCPKGSYVLQIHLKDNEDSVPRGISTELAPEDTIVLEHFGFY